jgi:hypothetical protein
VCTISIQQNYLTCPDPIFIYINGELAFTTGNKLTLPTGSVVTVNVGGVINPGNGGGSSNLITIGTTDVWNAGSGSLPGYVVLSVAPLPIELMAFNAKVLNGIVELSWTTATETNNDYFTIQRTSDGRSFDDLGEKIDGAGNSTVTLAYKAKDEEPIKGISYYRLKQTDFNGTTSYSALVNINMDENGLFSWNLVGNLNDGSRLLLEISSVKGQQLKLDICDNKGRNVYSQVIVSQQNGKYLGEYPLPVVLEAGMYVVNLSSENNGSGRKMVVR